MNGYSYYTTFLKKSKQKKPQQNAEASTTTAMVSLLQCEGRFSFFSFRGLIIFQFDLV